MKTNLSNLRMNKMNQKAKAFLISLSSSIVLGLISTSASSQAVFNSTFSVTPPTTVRTDPPSLMLSMSRDHQYHFKAYNDFTDLNPPIAAVEFDDFDINDPADTDGLDLNGLPQHDGFDVDDPADTDGRDLNGFPVVETTYTHSFTYFGYFDAAKCYDYVAASSRYVPESLNNREFNDDGTFANEGYCSGNWNGNFLNWATMTRMDIVRRIFFGGDRFIDERGDDVTGGGITVLERSFLPSDAHSFTKYYNGDDIAQLTPFSIAGDVNNNGEDDINEGITFCNTTADNTGALSQNSIQPPLIRMVPGNWQLWGAHERFQCIWDDESRSAVANVNNRTNANDPADSGINAESSYPDEQDDNGQEFIARVQVCVDGLIGSEGDFCKTYPNGNIKPIGILQRYGDDGLIDFGLMSGSYDSNTEGGVLRKNTGPLAGDPANGVVGGEVDVAVSGVFTFTNTSESIIRFLTNLRPWGYRYDDGTYFGQVGQGSDNCRFQLARLPGQANDPTNQSQNDGNTDCNSWGNPISEIYAETIRYMAALAPNPQFAADDTAFIDGLSDFDWEDPLNIDENLCSDLNTIVINASVSSYDSNNTEISDVDGGINGTTIASPANVTDVWTNTVGNLEGINGNDFFIGVGSNDDDEFCSAKTINNLSDASGLCPEAPTVSGSFDMAGIAYFAHNNDIRPDLPGNQTVNTFAISLATNVPVINVPRLNSADSAVTILPAYRLINGVDQTGNNIGEGGGGALVDFRIVEPHTQDPNNPNIFTGRFYVNWEDSEQGGDYDQDVWGIISYELNEANDEITITTDTLNQSTGGGQLFGFVVSGTSQDGFHAYSGVLNANFDDPVIGVPECNNCRVADPARSHTFSIEASTVQTLESPLFYAAKYGGFDESLNDGEELSVADEPDETQEFDAVINETGEAGSDGLPDDFFFVTNPESLFDSLDAALQAILAQDRQASTAVASFASNNGFANIIIQGAFQESTLSGDEEVIWTGELFSYFIDDFGFFREDSNSDGELSDSYLTDGAFRFDTTNGTAQIERLVVDINPTSGVPEITGTAATLVSISELDSLWDAAESLQALDNASTLTNRVYNVPAPDIGDPAPTPDANGNVDGSRYIFTHIDFDGNGIVDNAVEQRDFDENLIDATTVPYFGIANEEFGENIINFIRGYEASNDNLPNFDQDLGFRNRTITVDEMNNEFETFRLGDLVNSRPLTVARPTENYASEFNDQTYAGFAEVYENRRQVTYVGSNDGLLHAFNTGFRRADSAEPAYLTAVPQDPDERFTVAPGNSNPTQHPLGAEIWAYAPFNLLPHLQFLTLPNYAHQFYVDGSPQAFDVKIFEGVNGDCTFDPNNSNPNATVANLGNDCRYINGWGTILVVGMRQGGGDFPLNDPVTGNALTLPNSNEQLVARSSYIILDITNPELEPRVLAEVNHPDLNFTTSDFDVFYDCDTNCNIPVNALNPVVDSDEIFDGDWTLVFGSGPNDVRAFNTTETAKVFSVDLGSIVDDPNNPTVTTGTLGIEVEEVASATNSFVGGITVQDWDNGDLGFRNDDVAYFGTVQSTGFNNATGVTASSQSGSVFRYFPADADIPNGVFGRSNLLIDIDRPVFETPIALSRDTLTNDILASWIYIGTGIFLTRGDAEITEQEHFLGVIEPIDVNALGNLTFEVNREDSELLTYDEVDVGDLFNVTDIAVLSSDTMVNGTPVENGQLANTELVGGAAGTVAAGAINVTNVDQLAGAIVGRTRGWIRDLPSDVNGTPPAPSARITGEAITFNGQLFFTTFEPQVQTGFEICEGETGVSNIFALNQSTGTASTVGTFGDEGGEFGFMSDDIAGNISAPLIFNSESLGANRGVIITQKENNALTPNSQDGDASNRINNATDLRSSWREIN